MVTEDEFDTIHQRMTEAGVANTGAYIRKMALNGYVLNVDLAPVRGACFPATQMREQSESGCDSREHLRRVPGRD